MKFIADEGIDSQIVKAMRGVGHDVLYVAEYAPGITDNVVLESTNEEGRILITRDKDFGELVFRNKMVHSGIILNRLYELASEEKARIVLKVIEEFNENLIGAFTVIQPNKVRIKRL